MANFYNQNKLPVKKIAVVAGVSVVAILSAIFAFSLQPTQTVTGVSAQQNIVANDIVDSGGLYFEICGAALNPQKTLGTSDNPIVVKQGSEQTINIAFCGAGRDSKDAAYFLILESSDNMPLKTTKTETGTMTGIVAKGISVTFDKDFVDVPAAKMDAITNTVKSPSAVTFAMSVDIGKDADLGKHRFFVFASKPNSYGGFSGIGKPVFVEVIP